MPAPDPLKPVLTPAEHAIVESYGGWTQFMTSFGLEPSNNDAIKEAKKLVEAFVKDDEREEKEEKDGESEKKDDESEETIAQQCTPF